jgi:uncharacterized membrane protein
MWRVSLILPTSIAFVGLVLLGINYFWVYKFEYALGLISLFNFLFLGFHYLLSTKQEGYLNADPNSLLQRIKEKSKLFSSENLIIALAVIFFASAVIYAAVTPMKQVSLTDFYVLKPDRSIPLIILNDETETNLIIGINNYEGKDLIYSLIVQTVTEGGNEVIYYQDYAVKNDEKFETLLTLPPVPNNTNEIHLLLFKEVSSNPYRNLRLVIEKAN